MSVTALGYLGFEASDLAAWRAYATNFLGLMEASDSESDLRFRADQRAWRIAVSAGAKDDLAFAGFEVRDSAALAATCEQLKSCGYDVQRDEALAKARGVTGLASAVDPNGLQVEIFFGAIEMFEAPIASPAGVRGFTMGEQGLGHIVLFAKDAVAMKRFYMDGLGFRLSDFIDVGEPDHPTELIFLHCNLRHHTLALIPSANPKRLHHFMLQVDSMEDVGLAYDRAARLDVGVALTLGRHTNDHMFSFYALTPSGFQVEYGWGARTIGVNWSVVRHKRPSTWGHNRPGS